ncbi:MAG TPA: PIN domain-containing protein [Thermoanaerobaculia bacterium]|nr:PIN domain-containing protein [Thermoanaerobaculia bacterium]
MAGLRDIFFDTSVLIAGVIDFGRGPHPALLLMDAVADGRIERPMTAWHCCLEFYSVTTRLPEEYRLEPEISLRLLREEILPRFSVHDLPSELREDFLVSTVGEGTMGGRVYDAHIAEVARQAGARLVATENRRHFTPLLRHGIRVLVSAELVEEIGR